MMKIEDLEANGIFISEEPAHEGSLRPHIDKLRARLLDFSWTVADDDDATYHVDDVDFLKQLGGLGLHAADRALVEKCKGAIRDRAMILQAGQDREAEWARFFDINFFDPLEETVRTIRDEDTWQWVAFIRTSHLFLDIC